MRVKCSCLNQSLSETDCPPVFPLGVSRLPPSPGPHNQIFFGSESVRYKLSNFWVSRLTSRSVGLESSVFLSCKLYIEILNSMKNQSLSDIEIDRRRLCTEINGFYFGKNRSKGKIHPWIYQCNHRGEVNINFYAF